MFEKRCQTRCHRVLPRWHRVLSCNVFHRNLASFSVIYLSSALKTRNLAQIPMKHVLESLKKRATSTPRKRERRNETRWHRVRPDGIGSPDAIGPIPMPLCRKRPRGIGWGDSICFSNTTRHISASPVVRGERVVCRFGIFLLEFLLFGNLTIWNVSLSEGRQIGKSPSWKVVVLE